MYYHLLKWNLLLLSEMKKKNKENWSIENLEEHTSFEKTKSLDQTVFNTSLKPATRLKYVQQLSNSLVSLGMKKTAP